MTTITETSGGNDGSASWLKQRSTIFNNNANNKPAAKVVDKELARLKNIGAVSSVWSNKFVQEDNSGGTTEYKNNKRITPPPPPSPNDPPLSPRHQRLFIMNNIDLSPRPNANYISPTGIINRQSMTSPPPTSPRSPGFNMRVRTLSGNNKKMADDITAALNNNNNQQSPAEVKTTNNFGYFSKNSVSSLDLNEVEDNNNKSPTFNKTNSVRSSITSTTSTVPPSSPIARASADNFMNRSSSNSISSGSSSTNLDEAASLWFQCETLKTQYAQSNARLTRANEDIEFYKRQLEQQGDVSREGIATVVEEKEKELLRVRQLAELIVKQDKLLGEYEINLDVLTRLTNESVYLEETQAEMDGLRQELAALNKKKEQMEGAIAALKAELEMSYSQMRLMMVVSTEIQNEFDSYKEKMNSDIKVLLSQKQVEHEAELKALEEKLTATHEATIGVATNEAISERSITSSDDHDAINKQVAAAVASATASAAATAAIVAADHEKALGDLRKQVVTLTEALEAKDQAITEALQAKDKTISELETRLKTQKMSMDAQMMELNQTILEKDTLLMEFMSSRNNSREVITAAASMSSPTSAVPAATVTDTYYHSQENNDARLQIAQVRDYMFSSSDEDEDDEPEVLIMSYTTDEEVEEHHTQHQQHGHYHHMMNNDNHTSSAPQSPADTVSSSISFDSDEEEEKIAEIKHFSYSSVQSQTTRPVSLISTTESLSSNKDNNNNKTENNNNRNSTATTASRNSTTTPFSIAKETNAANWPMPPPTPPPSEPLPPVPVLKVDEEVINVVKEEVKTTSPIANMVSAVPPPRRARSKTMARDEAPDMSSVYTTSVHQTNELPRIIPLQKPAADETRTPVPPPRKDLPPTLNIARANSLNNQEGKNTKWMDDPESEEDEELWCEANNGTPKQQQQPQEWNIL